MKKLLFILLIVIASIAKQSAQIITTVAGNGTYVWAGDTGQATAAPIAGPVGVTFDAAGNMYIDDIGFHLIHKINTAGIISLFAGNGSGAYCGDGGPATAACINDPYSTAFDAVGNMYIADYFNNVIRKVNTAGIITTIAGNGTHGYMGDGGQAIAAELEYPTGVACDALGNLYITSSNSVRKVNTAGIITTIAGDSVPGYSGDGGQATAAKLFNPWGVTVDVSGNVYITDYNNNVIRKINTAGIITTIAGNGFGAGTGTGSFSGDGGSATAAELDNPVGGVAFDGAGNMCIADFKNNRIRMINTAGIISTVAGNGFGAPSSGGFSGDGGQATVAELYYPMGVAFDAVGNLYIADSGNRRLRKVSKPAGISLKSNLNTQISVYPNPVTENISLNIENISNYQNSIITIQNTLGQTVKKLSFTKSINVSGLAEGCYFLQITLLSGETYKAKFIKQ